MSASIHNSSVLSCLIGIALLMTGFVGFMAHSFSRFTAELEGVRLVDTKNLNRKTDDSKVCVVTTIQSDDTFEMPDNRQKAVHGRLLLCAIWPDSTQNVLIDWNRKSKFMRIPNGTGDGFLYVSPRKINYAKDTSTLAQLKIKKSRNNIEIRYFQYKFNLTGIQSKGEPKIILQRECIADSSMVALTITQNSSHNSADNSIDVVSITPYDVAKARQKGMSKSKTIYLIIGVVGILMFFVPERQAINTIEGTKNIVNKIINH